MPHLRYGEDVLSADPRALTSSLTDVIKRLDAAPQTPAIQEFAALARAHLRTLDACQESVPSSLLNKVLALNTDLLRAGIDLESTPSSS
jgi:hypothetical protein